MVQLGDEREPQPIPLLMLVSDRQPVPPMRVRQADYEDPEAVFL
jgi:hypothetical protein